MRQLVIIASTISVAAISAHTWNALAQEGGVPRPAESLSAKPSVPATRYQMFFDEGTPTRPSTNLKVKEASDLKMKEEKSKKGKIDAAGIQPPGLLANPGSKPKLEPGKHAGGGEGRASFHDLDFLRRIETPGPHEKGGQKSKQGGDDAALNAAACKAALAAGKPLPPFCRPTVQIDRTFLDRLEAERVEQFRSGPGGGFNPNKP
jgi:hypothetical protein